MRVTSAVSTINADIGLGEEVFYGVPENLGAKLQCYQTL